MENECVSSFAYRMSNYNTERYMYLDNQPNLKKHKETCAKNKKKRKSKRK